MHSLRRRLAKLHPELDGLPSGLPSAYRSSTSPRPRRSGTPGRLSTGARCRRSRSRGSSRGCSTRRGSDDRAPAGWFHPEQGRAHACPVRRVGRVLRPDFEFFETPKSAPPAARRGDAPLHRGAVRGARRHRREPAPRLRRTGRYRQDAARHRGGTTRRLPRPPRAAALLQPAAGGLAPGRDRGPGSRRHGAHPSRASAHAGRHRADARPALPPGVLAGGTAGDGP